MATKTKAAKTKAARRTGGNLPAPPSRIEAAERRQLGTAPPKGGSGYRTLDGRKVRVGLALEEVTLNRLRAAAVHRNETLSGVVNRALLAELAKLEKEHGKPYQPRDARTRDLAT